MLQYILQEKKKIILVLMALEMQDKGGRQGWIFSELVNLK